MADLDEIYNTKLLELAAHRLGDADYGIHTARAVENFPISQRPRRAKWCEWRCRFV